MTATKTKVMSDEITKNRIANKITAAGARLRIMEIKTEYKHISGEDMRAEIQAVKDLLAEIQAEIQK